MQHRFTTFEVNILNCKFELENYSQYKISELKVAQSRLYLAAKENKRI